MLHIFSGDDDFSVAQALKEIEAAWPESAILSANLSRLEGEGLSSGELQTTCNSAPFLAQQRLVVVRGLLARFQSRGQKDEAAPWQNYLLAVETMSPTTVLVLVEKELKADNPLFKALQPLAQVRHFAPLRGERLYSWIRQRVTQGGGRISPKAMRLLAELAGDDLWSLANEIEKLLLLAQGREIVEEDVLAIVYQAREVNIFRLVDAMLQGEMGAGRWLHQMLGEGVRPQRIIAMLARQLRLLVQTKELLDQGLPLADIQRRLAIPPFAFQQCLAQARASSWQRLKESYNRLLETDLAIKGGRWGEELALDIFLASLAKDKVG